MLDWIPVINILLPLEVILSILCLGYGWYLEKIKGRDLGTAKWFVIGYLVNILLFSASSHLCLFNNICVVNRASINVWAGLITIGALVSIGIFLLIMGRPRR